MKCRLCDGNTMIFQHPKTKRRFQWCAVCDGIQVHHNDLLTENLEFAEYSKHENSIENQGYVDYLNRFIDEVLSPVAIDVSQSSGLDFGSGPGPVLYKLLEERGLAMNHYDPYFHKEDHLLEETYDFVTSTEVVEHFYNPKESWSTLINCVKEEGYLAVMTSYHQRDIQRFLQWWYIREKSHVFFYSKRTMEWISKHHNLSIEYDNSKNVVVFKKGN